MSDALLSDELLAELGEDALVQPDETSKDGHRKRKQLDEQEQEPKLSKNQKRRLEGILKRKERDSKRDEYLRILEKHDISSDQRNLLLSTRSIGQKMSVKNQLKRILAKQKMGLNITEDERELLFPHYERDDMMDDHMFEELVAKSITVPENDVESICTKDAPQEEESLISADSLASLIRSKPISTASHPPKHDPSASSESIGSKMLNQLKLLKSSTSKPVLKDGESPLSTIEPNSPPSTEKYIPIPLHIPITALGIEQISSTPSNNPTTVPSSSSTYRNIHRHSAVQAARMSLPVCSMEQEIMEAIHDNDVIILCGETGSGKSTQVPQFLFEAGYGDHGYIGITQPRRVAAVSTCERVAYEMNQKDVPHNQRLIGYHIRHDRKTIGEACKIVFATDGILLKEATSDILMRKYSVVLLDEAHERNINTDILIGILSRSVSLRKQAALEQNEHGGVAIQPLKLVIMSATLRIDDFLQPHLFKTIPPVIKVENRQFSVTAHFSRRTELVNYLEETFSKICEIHKKLPDGGVLVFLTGKREILHMCRKLNAAINKSNKYKNKYEKMYDMEAIENVGDDLRCRDDDEMLADENDVDRNFDDFVEDDFEDDSDEEEDVARGSVDNRSLHSHDEKIDDIKAEMLRQALGFSTSTAESAGGGLTASAEEEPVTKPTKAYILPLFAVMSQEQQAEVFKNPPEGHRLIVIATNVAETSITIPGIKYVVDCGRQKERVYSASGISKFEVKWISKASAEQRAGRAGRTGPGHCYRLYSSAFYDQQMNMFQEPEIMTTPLEDVLLQMRALGIKDVETFPFPTPPPQGKLRQALKLLINIGAIAKGDLKSNPTLGGAEKKEYLRVATNSGGKLTAAGKLIAKFPINPRLSKILLVAFKSGLLTFGLNLVAVLSEKSPFSERNNSKIDEDATDIKDDEEIDKYKEKSTLWFHPTSDALSRLRTFGAYCHTLHSSSDANTVNEFCIRFSLHENSLERMFDLRNQLSQLCVSILHATPGDVSIPRTPPSLDEEIALRQVLLSGYCDSIARKAPALKEGTRRRRLTAYYSSNADIVEPIYIHPTSSLYSKDPASLLPEYVIYTELIVNNAGSYTYMTCVTEISASWIAPIAKASPLLQWSPPLLSPKPFYDLKSKEVMCYVVPKFGTCNWKLPVAQRPLRLCMGIDDLDGKTIETRKGSRGRKRIIRSR